MQRTECCMGQLHWVCIMSCVWLSCDSGQKRLFKWILKHFCGISRGAPLAQCARSAGAVQLFGCLAVLETHTL